MSVLTAVLFALAVGLVAVFIAVQALGIAERRDAKRRNQQPRPPRGRVDKSKF